MKKEDRKGYIIGVIVNLMTKEVLLNFEQTLSNYSFLTKKNVGTRLVFPSLDI